MAPFSREKGSLPTCRWSAFARASSCGAGTQRVELAGGCVPIEGVIWHQKFRPEGCPGYQVARHLIEWRGDMTEAERDRLRNRWHEIEQSLAFLHVGRMQAALA